MLRVVRMALGIALNAFKGMSWDQLETHLKSQ